MFENPDVEIHMKYLDILGELIEIGEFRWGYACLATLYRDHCVRVASQTKNIV